MQVACWVLGVEEDQAEDMLPDTISIGFPLIGDLRRYLSRESSAGDWVAPETSGEEEEHAEWERRQRRALVADFRRLYPGVLEARERHPTRIVDPFGLWLFAHKTAVRDLVVVHVRRGEGREAIAIVRITGPYFYREDSPWPHRLPVEMVTRCSFKLPHPYSGWQEVFSRAIEDSAVDHLARMRAGEPVED